MYTYRNSLEIPSAYDNDISIISSRINKSQLPAI
jgi:hypothetical protein